MTRIKIKRLIWDDWNKEHITKHGVTENEAEMVGNSFIYHQRSYNQRYLVVGRVGPRIVSLVLAREGSGQYYVVSARDADKKERRKLYEKEKKK